MQKKYFEIPDNIKEDIFVNSLYQELTPQQLLDQQLKIINRALRIRSTRKIKLIESQIKLF
jgi:hypothetical protein